MFGPRWMWTFLYLRTPKTHARAIAALSELEDHAAAELTPQDLVENVVVKVADEVEVDVSTPAWKVSYADAIGTSLRATNRRRGRSLRRSTNLDQEQKL